MRGLSLVLPTEPTKPALVISGTYREGDSFDKHKPSLSSDLILEMTWRGSQQQDEVHVLPQKPLAFKMFFSVGKKVGFFVFMVAFGLSIQSYMKLDSFEVPAVLDEVSTHHDLVLEVVPAVIPLSVVRTRKDSKEITKDNTTTAAATNVKNVTTPPPPNRVSTPPLLDRINHLLQDELSVFAPSRSSEGTELVPLGREVTLVTNVVTPQFKRLQMALGSWRTKDTPNDVCDPSSWQWLLHRQCRVERIGNDSERSPRFQKYGTPSFHGPVVPQIWTRQGRRELRDDMVKLPTTKTHQVSIVAETEILPASSIRTTSKKRRKPITFRETVMLSLQAHTTNFQQTQRDVQARHQAAYA